MNTRTTHAGLCATPWLSLCAAIALVSTASAQTQRYYPPQGGYSQPPPNYQQPPPGYGGYPQQPQTRYESPIEFLPKFGKRKLEEITPSQVLGLCEKIKERGAPATAVHAREIIQQVYRHAMARGLKIENPAENVKASAIATRSMGAFCG